ncbi:methyltransferase domain-containing protein [Chitinophaga silvatica]|uniref:Methyltransferase domain-containing protein n=1 Tax=Chitinophaga silvatica TaxID=2282649 RepID=A0A3E1Y8A8_9BACT|nr:methyltransferase domain-containing protein [Chitinophaga silvatica]RFS21421.1 methyltransferase domain-containing protein [Chitinophaga silvatica]
MELLPENELIWSPVVANNRMNRKRIASGVNSYEKELKFNPEAFLNNQLANNNIVKWLDLCCGEGNALLQYANTLAAQKMQQHFELKGIDLVDQFQPIPPTIKCVKFEVMPLVQWTSSEQYNLITCVHGIHYVGDKLKVLGTALKSLANKGILLMNIDLKSIKVHNDPDNLFLKQCLSEQQIDYNSRRKILYCEGPRDLVLNLTYLGANDKAGPNYTGQEAVDSYYVSG